MAEPAARGTMERPGADELAGLLGERLAGVLRLPHGELQWSPMGSVVPRLDAAAVLRVSDARGRARAVMLCSSPDAPGMVQRAMDRARAAKAMLGPALGSHILDPLAEGQVHGLSYAVLPHCRELARGRLAWRAQRALLSPLLFHWLWQVNAATVQAVNDDELDRRFMQPLLRLASLDVLTMQVRTAARHAADRLQSGVWQPRSVLMHGDLWKGNLLLRPATDGADALRWRRRFVLIDWPGAELRGHALFDLVRLAQSMRLSPRALRREVDRHCALLQCGREDALSHLLAALGQMAMNLEHFPMEAFARMVMSCHATLDELPN